MTKDIRFLKYFLMVLIALTGLLAYFPGPVYAGGMDGGGGDSDALEFRDLGRTLSEILKPEHIPSDLGLTVYEFARSTEVVRVVSTTELLVVKGKNVDAKNYPKLGLIELQKDRWEGYQLDPHKKIRLVIHEYVAVSGKNDDNGLASEKILTALLGNNETIQKLMNSYQRFTDQVFDCGLLSGLDVAFHATYLGHGNIPEHLRKKREALETSLFDSRIRGESLKIALKRAIMDTKNFGLKIELAKFFEQIPLATDVEKGKLNLLELREKINRYQGALQGLWLKVMVLKNNQCRPGTLNAQ